MAHVWNIIDGDIYVSKNGDDINGDGSMANPYASIEKAYQDYLLDNSKKKIIIGTGLYQETVSGWGNIHLIGDGDVVFNDDGLSCFTLTYLPSEGDDLIFSNLRIYYTSLRFYYVNYTPLHNNTIKFYKCTIKGFSPVYVNTSPGCNLILQNCFLNYSGPAFNNHFGTNSIYLYNNVIEGNGVFDISYQINIRNNNIFSNCYFANYSGQQYAFYNNFYNCIFKRNELLLTFTEMQETYGYLVGGMGLNPKFNNPEIGDYTLQPTSPCLFAGKNNANIGAYGLGYSFNANSSEFIKEGGAIFSQTTEVDDIIRTQQTINGITRFLFQLNAGHSLGNVESAWIDLQTIRYLLITHIFDNLIYNSLGVATSRADNLETAGEKAVYYDFELKYCNEESEKDTATFKNVIWNKPVTVDNSGNGNANSNFVASEAQYISARFIKIKFYIKEG